MELKRRVLFLRQPTALGGAEFRMLNWLRGIDYSRYHVMLGFTCDYFSARINALGLPVECVPLELAVKGNWRKVFLAWLKFLRALRPDKVILSDGWFYEWPPAVVWAAYLASSGTVYMSEHAAHPLPQERTSRLHFGFLPGFGLWWYRAILPWRMRAHLSKRILAVSQGVKDWLVDSYGYPASKVEVVYKGVDMSRFCRADGSGRAAARAAMGLPAGATVLVTAARLSPEKRLDRLIRAFDLLAKDRPELWLLLAGEGEQAHSLQSLASACKASSRIKFLGFQEDVSRALKASDIFVLPSDLEGLATSLVEAMASELVCVSTNTVGPAEVIEDKRSGIIVPISDAGVLDGIQEALGMDEASRRLMGARARESVVRRFDLWTCIRAGLRCFQIEAAPDLPDGSREKACGAFVEAGH